VTPELEQPDNPDTEATGAGGSGVSNTACGVVGAVVQAGVVHGGVHLHSAPLPASVVPRQLPAASGVFAARGRELAELDRALTVTSLDAQARTSSPEGTDMGSGGPMAGATVVIGGAGGIGKTWLVLRWANARVQWFPDGQLFVDLRGFSPNEQPMPPAQAVRGFLDALGVDPGRVPTELEAQAALYRSLLAERRMLIVLDNAATAEQVTPLLPGGRSCTVLITSRKILTGLITRHGARHLNLDVLTDTEAYTLLERRLGARRLAAEPQAVTELLVLCRGFPLALGLLAGRAHTDPHMPLSQLAAELSESGVDALDDDDPTASLPAVLTTSYQGLRHQQREVFALLGIAPGPDIGLPAAASLTSLPLARTGRILLALQNASLLSRNALGRYFMHDLIRGYATKLAHELADAKYEAANRRVVDFYLRTAHAADRLLEPHAATPIELDPPEPGCHSHTLSSPAAATRWFGSEYVCLLAAQRTASARHNQQAVWRLAWALSTFQIRQGHSQDHLTVWMYGLVAADRLGQPTPQLLAQRSLGLAYARLERHEEALHHLQLALAIATHVHDKTNQARTHQALAWTLGRRGDDQRALEHAEQGLDLYRTLGSPIREADALNQVGWHAARLGDHEEARENCEAALILHLRHHNRSGEADTLDSLAYIDHLGGQYLRAIEYYMQALTLRRELSDVDSAATILDRLGRSHFALGQHDQASAVWLEALELYGQLGRNADAERVQLQLDALNPLVRPTQRRDQSQVGGPGAKPGQDH
jgi:tetratricopeptide (TPR) repeat protein